MAFSVEITRPDDLLRLRIEGRNLRIDRPPEGAASVVVDDVAAPAYLIVHLAPQAIAERGFFEATPVNVGADDSGGHKPQPLPAPAAIEPPGVPGSVPARIAQGSRLVFKVTPGTSLPYTVEGLLDWSALEPSVSGIAAIGPQPTPEEIAGAPGIAPPADTETALELPYRLVVSPTARMRWAHRLAPFTSFGRTEVWHTRLQWPGGGGSPELSAETPASLRAIWSEDFNSPIGLNPNLDDPELGRAALSPNDRHQIVVKTSAFHGYEGEVELSLPVGGPLSNLFQTLGENKFSYWAPYVPEPFYAEQLMLSSLGGWLRSHGNWPVLQKAKPRFRFEPVDFGAIVARVGDRDFVQRPVVAEPIAPYFGLEFLHPTPHETQPLDLSEWVHIASQGRDHYARVVYEGELLPFHNRAALVKVTERKFREQGGTVVAHLYQRFFIVVREPEKLFAEDDYGMPLKRVRITTVVTPDLAPPAYVVNASRSFWVEVMTGAGAAKARFPFHVVVSDADGTDAIDFTMPMMFLSRSASGKLRDEVIAQYNDSSTFRKMADRSAAVPGHKIAFARRDPAATTSNTQLATRTLTFAVAANGPQLLKAEVKVPQVEELLGRDAPTTIRLHPQYVAGGFDPGAAVFAEVVRETPASGDPFKAVAPTTLGVTFSADQAGGIATPNLAVSTLTRKHGPVAGKAADAIADTFDPKSFFPKGTASLFGTFDLFDLLLDAALGDGAPKLQTATEDLPGGGKAVVATIDWEPPISDLDLGVAAFNKGAATRLKVHGRIEKPLDGSAGRSRFEGRLNDFNVTVLKVVRVRFVEFGFLNESGRKPDVTVRLDPASPLEFQGDLIFVEELRKAIPPDLFGAGPSLDLSPSGIRAGFSFALPPVSVGVFALRDVSLGASLTLPFLDGRPSLDFNVSERPHPFLLSVGIFGGGGFFHLQLDTAGLKLVEAAFEFGATASIDLGVASGGVHIMAGIYFKLERKEPGTELAPTLSGYLRLGGHLSVLGLIKVSLEFVLSFTYDGGRDKAYGRATLTVQVEIAFFSTSVELTVEKAFGGSSGDPVLRQLFTTPATWSEYAEAFA